MGIFSRIDEDEIDRDVYQSRKSAREKGVLKHYLGDNFQLDISKYNSKDEFISLLSTIRKIAGYDNGSVSDNDLQSMIEIGAPSVVWERRQESSEELYGDNYAYSDEKMDINSVLAKGLYNKLIEYGDNLQRNAKNANDVEIYVAYLKDFNFSIDKSPYISLENFSEENKKLFFKELNQVPHHIDAVKDRSAYIPSDLKIKSFEDFWMNLDYELGVETNFGDINTEKYREMQLYVVSEYKNLTGKDIKELKNEDGKSRFDLILEKYGSYSKDDKGRMLHSDISQFYSDEFINKAKTTLDSDTNENDAIKYAYSKIIEDFDFDNVNNFSEQNTLKIINTIHNEHFDKFLDDNQVVPREYYRYLYSKGELSSNQIDKMFESKNLTDYKIFSSKLYDDGNWTVNSLSHLKRNLSLEQKIDLMSRENNKDKPNLFNIKDFLPLVKLGKTDVAGSVISDSIKNDSVSVLNIISDIVQGSEDKFDDESLKKQNFARGILKNISQNRGKLDEAMLESDLHCDRYAAILEVGADLISKETVEKIGKRFNGHNISERANKAFKNAGTPLCEVDDVWKKTKRGIEFDTDDIPYLKNINETFFVEDWKSNRFKNTLLSLACSEENAKVTAIAVSNGADPFTSYEYFTKNGKKEGLPFAGLFAKKIFGKSDNPEKELTNFMMNVVNNLSTNVKQDTLDNIWKSLGQRIRDDAVVKKVITTTNEEFSKILENNKEVEEKMKAARLYRSENIDMLREIDNRNKEVNKNEYRCESLLSYDTYFNLDSKKHDFNAENVDMLVNYLNKKEAKIKWNEKLNYIDDENPISLSERIGKAGFNLRQYSDTDYFELSGNNISTTKEDYNEESLVKLLTMVKQKEDSFNKEKIEKITERKEAILQEVNEQTEKNLQDFRVADELNIDDIVTVKINELKSKIHTDNSERSNKIENNAIEDIDSPSNADNEVDFNQLVNAFGGIANFTQQTKKKR